MTFQIRAATQPDSDAMWDIFRDVAAKEDSLPFASSFPRDIFQSHWLSSPNSYVAATASEVLGMYRLGPNYPDLGSHVASATYLVRTDAQGHGIGRALVEHSIAQAQREGFMALQFNYVVSTNTIAVALYQRLGFSIVGTLPRTFRHRERGFVDTFVMHRFL